MKRELTQHQEVMAEIEQILSKNEEALLFIASYAKYVEIVDDMVDEEHNKDRVEQLTDMSAKLFNSNYWTANRERLYLVEKLIHIFYFASTEWETSHEDWKRRDARAISHFGYSMLFAVLLLETNDTKLVQSIAVRFMERCHLRHVNDMLVTTETA